MHIPKIMLIFAPKLNLKLSDMVRIYKQLSKKSKVVDTSMNKTSPARYESASEVLLRLRNGNDYDINAKSGIFVTGDNFKRGEISVNRQRLNNSVDYHEEMKKRLTDLENAIYNAVKNTDKESISKEWLTDVINRHNHPEKFKTAEEIARGKDVYQLILEFIDKNDFSEIRNKCYLAIAKTISRYERFVRHMADVEHEDARKNFVFNVHNVTSLDLEDLFSFMRNEYSLSLEYPKLFKELTTEYPTGLGEGKPMIKERSSNTMSSLERMLSSFFGWLARTGRTQNRPFENIKVASQKYGEVYFLTIEERNKVADYDFSANKTLERQRDIFVFQCLVGCRYSDLQRLTEDNIKGNVLTYIPTKTADESGAVATVPLAPRALAIVEKYRGASRQGRLLPTFRTNYYSRKIREILTAVGITRKVLVRDAITEENVMRPLNEIASSHIARRTFINAAYQQVADPALIGRMSGHVEGSKAFSRYRKISTEQLQDIINKIGG